jgi:hypothetical protein
MLISISSDLAFYNTETPRASQGLLSTRCCTRETVILISHCGTIIRYKLVH